jgi:hypothetical protein
MPILTAMFQEVHFSAPYAIVGSLVTIAGVYGAAFLATGKANARSQGVIETKIEEGFKEFRSALSELKQVDRDQWKRLSEVEGDIGDARERVARIEGRMNGENKGRGAGAGGR